VGGVAIFGAVDDGVALLERSTQSVVERRLNPGLRLRALIGQPLQVTHQL
jgi:hypothetical protein